MNSEKPKVTCLPHGPYNLLNDLTPQTVPNLVDSNGDPCATVAGVAPCRCGGSSDKASRDGSHWHVGFED